MDSLAVAAPLNSCGITGKDQEAKENKSAAERPLGSIATALASSSPPSFSSDDEDGGSSSSFVSSTSTLYSDDEEEQGEEADSLEGFSPNSPLSKMSDLMVELPIKRGLSRHYNGKSQSYTSLANVTSIHDLPKPERGPARKKLKSCRSYGGGMADHVVAAGCHNSVKFCLPAAAAVLGNKTGSSSSSLQLPPPIMGAERNGAFLRSSWRPPPTPTQHRPGRFPASQPQALLFA